ncbi:caspase-7-like isoform X2 [Amblyomma americanum]
MDICADGAQEKGNSTAESDAKPHYFGHVSTPQRDSGPALHTQLVLQQYNNAPIRRGRLVIFNNRVFQPHTNLAERTGADVDEKSLQECFTLLGFAIDTPRRNLSAKDIKEELKKLGEEDYRNYDCFVCCFLTHGTDKDTLYASDGNRVSVDDVMAPFHGDKCRSLRGKPKLFFIQACRGGKLQRGISLDSADARGVGIRIPTHADFLVAYSTVPGFVAWRDPERGSWFVQRLCSVLLELAPSTDLLHMLTVVCKRVAFPEQNEVAVKMSGEEIIAKQMPCFTSTLTHLVYFSRSYPTS